MSLMLYFHPLSSFCHKALIALYENETPFERRVVNLMDQADAAAFKKIWPIGKFPVLHDDAAGRTIPESSIIIEYLDQYCPGQTRFIPADAGTALRVREGDRFFDLYVELPMQKVIGDRMRPPDKKDPLGVEEAKARLKSALDIVEKEIAGKTWYAGDAFTMADCAAAPALFYADKVLPFAGTHKNVAGYLKRLLERPSYARAIEEARPFFHLIPKE